MMGSGPQSSNHVSCHVTHTLQNEWFLGWRIRSQWCCYYLLDSHGSATPMSWKSGACSATIQVVLGPGLMISWLSVSALEMHWNWVQTPAWSQLWDQQSTDCPSQPWDCTRDLGAVLGLRPYINWSLDWDLRLHWGQLKTAVGFQG